MKQEKFTYRPDGDLNEYIGHGYAQLLIAKARKASIVITELEDEYIIYRIIRDNKLLFYSDEYKDMSRQDKKNKTIEIIKKGVPDEAWNKIRKFWEDNPEEIEYFISRFKEFNYATAKDYDIISENNTITYICKPEKVKIVLTNKRISSEKVMEGSSWGGVSDDKYEGIITYESEQESKFIATNQSDDEFGKHLKKLGIQFSKRDFNIKTSDITEYCYTYEGNVRFAYERCVRVAIDDIIFITVVFSETQPSNDMIESKIFNLN